MVKYSEAALKVICLVFGALCLYQLSIAVFRNSPLDRLSIPELPHLPGGGETQSGGAKTNTVALPDSGRKSSNSVPVVGPSSSGTNSVSNHVAGAVETNSSSQPVVVLKNTNAVPAGKPTATNSVTTPVVAKADAKVSPNPGPGAKGAEFPPQIQARIDRITQSEILGQVMRPLPMGLLGIAGNVAFLRAANGQTGMVKEGDVLGGIKLLRIGVNRVLIENEGKTNELTMFSGFGSETLLQKTKETTNEPSAKSR